MEKQKNSHSEPNVQELTRSAMLNLLDDLKEEIKARKLTEEKLLKSEEHFRSLIENSSEGISIIDISGNTIYSSPTMKTVLGYSEEEVEKVNCFSFVHPDHLNTSFEMFRRFISGKTRTETIQIPMKHKNGDYIWIEATGTNMLGNDSIKGIVINFRNIDERKKTEQKLSVMAKMLDIAPNAITIHDLHGNFFYTNSKNLELHGYTFDEMMNINLHQLDTLESETLINKRMEEIRKTGEASFEVRHFRKDGSIIPLQVFTKIIDWNGKTALISVASDMTDRLRSEQKIHESERTLRSLMNNLPGMVYRCVNDRSWTMKFVSMKCFELTGYSAEDLINNKTVSYNDLIFPEFREEIWDKWQKAVSNKESVVLEYKIKTKNGREKWVLEHGEPVFSANGGLEFLEGFISDVTQLKSAQHELIKSEDKFRSLFQMHSAIKLIVDPENGRIIEANSAAENYYGWSSEELRSKTVFDLNTLPASEARQYLNRIMSSEQNHFEFQHRKADGTIADIEVFSSRISSEGRDFIHSIVHDVTEKRKAEIRLGRISENNRIASETQLNLLRIENAEEMFKILAKSVHQIIRNGIVASVCLSEADDNSMRIISCEGLDGMMKTITDVLGFDPTAKDYSIKNIDENELKKYHFGKLEIQPDGLHSLLGNTVPDTVLNEVRNLLNVKSVLTIGVPGQDKPLGCIIILAKEGAEYYPEIIEKLVSHAASVIQRKKAEEKLKETLALMRIAGEIAKLGGWNVDLKANRSYWSDEVAAIHEMPSGFAPLLDEGISFYAPEWREKITRVFTACAKEGIPYNERMEIITATGKRVWIKTIGEAVRNEKGEIFKVHGAFQDISDQVKAEETILESEDRFRTVSEYSHNGICIIDLSGKIIWANDSLAKIGGYSKEQMYSSESFIQYIAPESVEFVVGNFMKFAAGEEYEHHYSFYFIKSDGEKRLCEKHMTDYKDRSGNRFLTISVMDVTDQKKAEIKLRESEERFMKLSSFTFEGIIIHNKGIAIDMNQSAVEMLGYERDEITGMNLFKIIHPDFHETVKENIAKQFATPYQIVVIRKNGSVFDAEIEAKDMSYNGEHFRVACLRDITQRKKTEKKLIESEEKFRQLADSTTAGIFIHGGEEFHYINNSTTIHTGYSFEELYNMKFIDLVYPDDRQMVVDVWNKRNKGGSVPNSYECRLNKKTGGFIWAEISANLLDFNGKKALIGTAFDITDRKLAEEKLKKSESTLQKIFNILPIGLWFADKTGKLINGNPAGVKIWGAEPKVSMEEYGVFKARRLPGNIEIQPDEWALKKTITEGVTIEDELLEIDAFDGSKKIVLNYTAPILDDDGKVHGAIVINEDITEKYNAEKEKEKLQAQLSQSQKMESIGRLAGGVAHDFNNMLSVIIGRTDLAMMKIEPGNDIYSELSEIRNAAERSAALTGQLLAFARKQVITPKSVSLNSQIDKMYQILNRLIGENIVLKWERGGSLWNILFDPSQIDQILANLCVNAKDAIKESGTIIISTGNISVTEHDRSDLPGIIPGEYVLLKISDDGCGMEDAVLKHIFEPFFTTKDIGKGTGLGLATVFGIVKQNRGFIYARSIPGSGSEFNVYLPRYKDSDKLKPDVEHETANTGNETILLVEDDPSILEMSETMLKNFGYSVISADSPLKALAKAIETSGEIDLLITDIIMPELNGKELAKKIMTLHPGIKCLFISGYTADVIAHEGVLGEETNFLQKPFTMKSLGDKIKNILGGK